MILVRAVLAEDYEGVVLVAGRPADAANTPYAGEQGGAVGGALRQVPPIEGDQIQAGRRQIQAQRRAAAQADFPAAPVDDPDSAGNEVVFLS